jgi:glycosyltransferase involved in cell wall biosynthesis
MNTKIKLLIINSTLEKSGLTNVILNICKNIDYQKFDVNILTLSIEPTSSLWSSFKKLPIKIESIGLNRINWIFKGKTALINKVNEINPDIIQTISYRGTVSTIKYLNSYKIVSTLQADIHKNYTDTYGKIIGNYIANQELSAFKNANSKIVCSNSLKQVYSSQIANINVVQNGIDNTIFHKIDSKQKTELRTKLGYKNNDTIFISVGALSKRKDPLTIINAFKKSTIGKDSKLIFLGNGPLLNQCISASKGLNIEFIGNVDNTHEYYKIADAFISASSSEGLPNSVLEAGMCGLFCYLSNIPQHTEIFEEVKTQAVFFNCGDVNELAKQIDNYKTTSKSEKSIDFNALKMAKQYEEIYLNIYKNT